MTHSLKIFFLLFLFASLLSGCARMDRREKLSDLQDALQSYAAALRWERYSDAYEYIQARDGSKPALDTEGFDGYRVTDIDIIRSDLNLEETEAKTYVAIHYYKDTSGTVREIKEAQDWWYDADRKRWFLDGDLPYPDG